MAWRCYAAEALDNSLSRYRNRSSLAYCTRDSQIKSLIWKSCMRWPFQDQTQREHWDRCKNATMVDEASANMAYEAVRLVIHNNVQGDIVEAGVWMGGLSCYMALAAARKDALRSTRHEQVELEVDRRIEPWHMPRHSWLLDTFEGLPAPTSKFDGPDSFNSWTRFKDAVGWTPSTHDGHKTITPAGRGHLSSFCYASREQVESTMARTRQPAMLHHYVTGKVEETLHGNLSALPARIAVLRLDTDWYESTKAELDVLWPKLSPGGWLYVDDYFAVAGARKAVDHWLQHHGWEAHARAAGAFNQPRFALFKASPYSRSDPFAKGYARVRPLEDNLIKAGELERQGGVLRLRA